MKLEFTQSGTPFVTLTNGKFLFSKLTENDEGFKYGCFNGEEIQIFNRKNKQIEVRDVISFTLRLKDFRRNDTFNIKSGVIEKSELNMLKNGIIPMADDDGRISRSKLTQIKFDNPKPVKIAKSKSRKNAQVELTTVSAGTKKCTKCESKGRESIHPVSEFPNNKSQKDGLSGWCKQCHIDYRTSRKK